MTSPVFCRYATFLVASLALLSGSSYAQQSWTINTFAGGGPNNIPASGTAIGYIGGVATDPSGTLFISGSIEGEIWKATSGNLVIVAGAGVQVAGQSYALSGDGGPATKAILLGARQIGFDQSGNFYIPDSVLERVRKVDKNGIITLVAGSGAFQNGTCVFDGDGPATQHALCSPSSVAVDAAGNVYISDALNNRIRKVDPSGNMTTIAGSGALDFYGNCVFDGDGPATQHALCVPQDITFDGKGNLYIADGSNMRIRKVDSSGNMTTVAGNGTAGFSGDGQSALVASLNGPAGIAVDAAGNIYIGDEGNSRVREVNTSGIINTIAGDGSCTYDGDGKALQHSICFAGSLALDQSGNVYVADANQRVRKVDPQGNLTTISGNGTIFDSGTGGPATQEPIYDPYAIATDPGGNVYAMACYGIRTIDVQGNLSPLTGNESVGPCISSQETYALAADGLGNIYFTNAIHVYKQNSQGITTIAGTENCTYDGDGIATQHSVCNPEGLAIDGNGNLYIADTSNNLIRKIDTSGNMTTIGGYYFNPRLGCLFDGDGQATSHRLCEPWNLALDTNGNLYFTDSGNLRLRVISLATDILTTIAGNGMLKNNHCIFDGDGSALQHSLCSPTGVTALPSGDVVVLDYGNLRVRDISGGNMTTIVNTQAVNGFEGDGGPATAALLDNPLGLTSDSNGSVYIADAYNNRVRRLTLANTTTATLTASPNPSNFGQATSLTAEVTSAAGTPTGYVTFNDGLAPLGTVVLKQGMASLKVSTLAPGTHSLTALYGGGGSFAASVSSPVVQAVNKAVPVITLTSSPNPSKVHQEVIFSVVVGGKAGIPTGSVTLKQGAKTLGTGQLANGNMSFKIAFSPVGTYTIVAEYSGDQNYKTKNSAALKQVVK